MFCAANANVIIFSRNVLSELVERTDRIMINYELGSEVEASIPCPYVLFASHRSERLMMVPKAWLPSHNSGSSNSAMSCPCAKYSTRPFPYLHGHVCAHKTIRLRLAIVNREKQKEQQ